jgi:F-type H+-transporting ATPase subunit a
VIKTETKKQRHLNRWIVVFLLVTIVIVTSFFAPIRPVVTLPGEPISGVLFTLPVIGAFKLTNTFLTTLLIDLFLIYLALLIRRGLGDENKPSRGVALLFETMLEALYNMAESTAGKKWARQIFPLVATIIVLVLVSNLIKLLPGMESIGLLEPVTGADGFKKVELFAGLSYIVKETATTGQGYEVVPFFRSPSTDLNFTLALALIAVVMVQVFGIRANKLGYFSKFLNFGRFFKMWTKPNLNAFDAINPFIDIFVGMLEAVAEFAKIISFSFRLLGSMFGGAILVAVIGSLLPFAQFGVYFLELFFGVIQALVFGVLTLVFSTVAIQSHGSHAEEQAH